MLNAVRGTVSVLLLIVSQAALVAQGSPQEPWLCRTYSGKRDGTITVRQAHTLQWYANHLPDFDSEVAWRVKNESGWKNIKAAPRPVGMFHKRDVAYILFTIPSKPNPVGKLVLIDENAQFRPVVWILADTDIEFAPSAIVHVSQSTVLVNRDRVSGTGGVYFEDYFVFDGDSEVPINLRVGELIASTLKKLLPHGKRVWKGGGFDIESLHYSQGVWNESDPNCCPSAGKVDVQLSIKNNEAAVASAAYDPAYKWAF